MKTNSDLITVAEAHLFVGIAKADGEVEREEFTHIPYYAEKSQRFFDMMNINSETAGKIRTEIRDLLSQPQYRSWDSYEHLDEAMELLKKAKDAGLWQTKMVFSKNEAGFTESAKINGFVVKEATFINAIESRLKELHR